jgi:hypothetical protein
MAISNQSMRANKSSKTGRICAGHSARALVRSNGSREMRVRASVGRRSDASLKVGDSIIASRDSVLSRYHVLLRVSIVNSFFWTAFSPSSSVPHKM